MYVCMYVYIYIYIYICVCVCAKYQLSAEFLAALDTQSFCHSRSHHHTSAYLRMKTITNNTQTRIN